MGELCAQRPGGRASGAEFQRLSHAIANRLERLITVVMGAEPKRKFLQNWTGLGCLPQRKLLARGRTLQENPGYERGYGRQEPLDSPGLNDLPIEDGLRIGENTRKEGGNGAGYAQKEGDKGGQREAEHSLQATDFKAANPAWRERNTSVFSASVAKGSAGNELDAAFGTS